MTVTQGDLIEVSKFTQYVYDQCKAYLTHHNSATDVTNSDAYRNVDYGKDEIPYGTAKPYSSKVNTRAHEQACWDWTDNTKFDRILGTITQYCNSFKNKYGKEINAADTWDFIVNCFYETNCIAEQTFSYYASATDESSTPRVGYGTLENYYKGNKIGYKNALANDSMIKKLLIEAGKTKDLIAAVIEFNKRCEIIYNHGCRNEKDSYYLLTQWVCTAGPVNDSTRYQAVKMWQQNPQMYWYTMITGWGTLNKPGKVKEADLKTFYCAARQIRLSGSSDENYLYSGVMTKFDELILVYPPTDSSQHIYPVVFSISFKNNEKTEITELNKKNINIELQYEDESITVLYKAYIEETNQTRFLLKVNQYYTKDNIKYNFNINAGQVVTIINDDIFNNIFLLEIISVVDCICKLKVPRIKSTLLLHYTNIQRNRETLKEMLSLSFFSNNIYIRCRSYDIKAVCKICADEVEILSNNTQNWKIIGPLTFDKGTVFSIDCLIKNNSESFVEGEIWLDKPLYL